MGVPYVFSVLFYKEERKKEISALLKLIIK